MYFIFTYMKTIKIKHPWIGKYTVRPMEGMGSDAFSKASDGSLEKR